MSQEIQVRILKWSQENAGTESVSFDEVRFCGLVDGATFFQQSIMPEELGRFAEWLDYSGWFMRDKYNWAETESGDNATTEQLVNLYLKSKD